MGLMSEEAPVREVMDVRIWEKLSEVLKGVLKLSV